MLPSFGRHIAPPGDAPSSDTLPESMGTGDTCCGCGGRSLGRSRGDGTAVLAKCGPGESDAVAGANDTRETRETRFDCRRVAVGRLSTDAAALAVTAMSSVECAPFGSIRAEAAGAARGLSWNDAGSVPNDAAAWRNGTNFRVRSKCDTSCNHPGDETFTLSATGSIHNVSKGGRAVK